MEDVLKLLSGALLLGFVLFIGVVLSTLLGGVVGWCVGLVFDDTIAALKDFLGVKVTDFELGAIQCLLSPILPRASG